MLIGLSGGLSPAAALLLARETHRDPDFAMKIDQVMRRSVQEGLAGSLLNSRGVGGRLFRQVGAAQLSGAPLGLALTALATEQRAATRAAGSGESASASREDGASDHLADAARLADPHGRPAGPALRLRACSARWFRSEMSLPPVPAGRRSTRRSGRKESQQ